MAQPVKPEPKFFLIDELYAKGLAYYGQTWFSGIPEGVVCGEKSTNYLESAVAAERMGRDVLQAKLIFVLRNPIDRAYSNFRWTRQNGLETEVDFARALDLEAEREASLPEKLRVVRPFSYFSRGLYADLLRPYLDRFLREQVLIVLHEDVCTHPDRVAETLHRFLGVEPRPQDAGALGVINAAEDRYALPLSQDVRAALEDRYREPNLRLAQLLGFDQAFW